MPNRRAFLAGLLATGLAPRRTWAEAGNPAFLSAAKTPDGDYCLCGLTRTGKIAFQRPLPARGHAAAAHPHLAQAVAFARRPGTFAIVLDCVTGTEMTRLTAPQGRHFYGHGTFSADGDLLFTTENAYDSARGMIGVWDVRAGYTRVAEFSSGGIGPHDIKLMPDGDSLVVANGGIETHPETGRTKLNLPTMRANLTYLALAGHIREQIALPPEHQKNSIRHLSVARNGAVGFAMQWQGDLTNDLPLLGLHHRDTGTLHLAHEAHVRQMNGYLGSVALSGDGRTLATTSPRRGRMQVFRDMTLIDERALPDVCGVAATADGFVVTTGTGLVRNTSGHDQQHALAWDNHLIPLPVGL
ncbi:MAG: DUF1513 domain-containing protein [Rhodobacteraceae bacterium]|nr:DUF1513 domain-containing protein [Paracoccaceae bacterium]